MREPTLTSGTPVVRSGVIIAGSPESTITRLPPRRGWSAAGSAARASRDAPSQRAAETVRPSLTPDATKRRRVTPDAGDESASKLAVGRFDSISRDVMLRPPRRMFHSPVAGASFARGRDNILRPNSSAIRAHAVRCSRFPKTAFRSSHVGRRLRYHGWNHIHNNPIVNIAGQRRIFGACAYRKLP